MSEQLKKAVPKWYKKMSMWKVIMAILAPIAGGELLVYFNDVTLPVWVHTVVGICGVLLFFIRLFVKDEDHDGIVD